MFAPQLWPPPKKEELQPAWRNLTSIVIVRWSSFTRSGCLLNQFSCRHPFARLASVYYQKFVELKEHKAWGPLVKGVVKKFRPDPNSGDPTLATPSEFLSFILDDLKKRGPENVDQHWRPQHLSCPFCSLDFTVYAHMEELSEDSAYFITKVSDLLFLYSFFLDKDFFRNTKLTGQSSLKKICIEGKPDEADRPGSSVEPSFLQGFSTSFLLTNISINYSPRAPVRLSSGLRLEWTFLRSWRRPIGMISTCLGTTCRSILTALIWTLCWGLVMCPTQNPDTYWSFL